MRPERPTPAAFPLVLEWQGRLADSLPGDVQRRILEQAGSRAPSLREALAAKIPLSPLAGRLLRKAGGVPMPRPDCPVGRAWRRVLADLLLFPGEYPDDCRDVRALLDTDPGDIAAASAELAGLPSSRLWPVRGYEERALEVCTERLGHAPMPNLRAPDTLSQAAANLRQRTLAMRGVSAHARDLEACWRLAKRRRDAALCEELPYDVDGWEGAKAGGELPRLLERYGGAPLPLRAEGRLRTYRAVLDPHGVRLSDEPGFMAERFHAAGATPFSVEVGDASVRVDHRIDRSFWFKIDIGGLLSRLPDDAIRREYRRRDAERKRKRGPEAEAEQEQEPEPAR